MAGRAMTSSRLQRIVAVMILLACMAAAGACAVHTVPGPGGVCLMAVLLACALLNGLQRCHRSEYPAGISGLWELPAVVLAPPVFAFTVLAAAAAIACWPARRLACAVEAGRGRAGRP